MTRRRLALTFGLLVCGSAAWADAARTPPVHEGPKVSVQAYGKQNPQCLSWTNGCVLCTTDADGASHCSMPGIACQPRGLHCKQMR